MTQENLYHNAIKTILRRATSAKQKKEPKGNFTIDKRGHTIRFKGKPLELTAAEFDVLELLSRE